MSKLLIVLGFASVFCVSAAAQSTSGWKTVTTDTKQCQASTRANWTTVSTNPSVVFFDPEDGSGFSGTIAAAAMTSWQEVKSTVKHNLGGPKVHVIEDSDTRLWLEYPTGRGSTSWNIFVARPGKGYYCSAQITAIEPALRTKLDSVFRQVATSLTPLK